MPTLNWIGKDAVVKHHQEVPFHLLKDVPDLACGDPGSGNLIVQGDNLVALKALLPHYAGQVKCVCIDPPYNTGNEGWAYNDNVNSPVIREWLGKVVGKEGETLDRHDRWLCMMYPRLALLRQFLSEDGSIFVCLDDNEIALLRLLMDEVFGSQNFVATFVWENFYGRSGAASISPAHNYVVLYARSPEKWKAIRNLIPRDDKSASKYKNPDNDSRGPWRLGPIFAAEERHEGLMYSITTPSGRIVSPPKGSHWRISEADFWKMVNEGRIVFGSTGNNNPAIKLFLNEVQGGLVPRTWWPHDEGGHTQEAKRELQAIFPETVPFATPKPTRLIERILQIATNPGDLILDSFAGSGTTGHAVLKMNAANTEQEPRRFIMVEMQPEIARNITRERVSRVAEGYKNAKGEQVDGLGGGFRFCELGEPLFDETGQIRETVRFGELARHVYFCETGEPLPRERVPNTPLLGICRGVAVYLLFNGILGDKTANGGNVLTRKVLALLPPFNGPKVIYCAGCLIGAERLAEEGVTIRQTPYEIRVS
jgi:site-specific DNA-methyltransferase (adenine-specific)/adenine-specific DNA-methyltransferase